MKRKKIDLFQERQIIINMIVSTRFLKEISNIVQPKYFKSQYGKLISRWILEYWNEFKIAPGKQIQNIFYQKGTFIQDEDDREDVSDFLSFLSKEWEEIEKEQNIDFLIKNAIHYLKIRSLEILKDKLESSIIEGNPLKGEQNIIEYNRVEKISGIGVSLLKDSSAIISAFLEENEIMFKFPGVFGEVCGLFLRGDLVSFLAAAKKGKTWLQLYIGETAAAYGYKTIIFTLEMTQNQILRRGWQLLVGMPRISGSILIPRFEKTNTDKKKRWKVIMSKKKKKGVNVSNIEKEQKKLKTIFRSGDLKIVTLPAYSATIEDLEAYLDNFYYFENYVPDVIIVDYADIVAPSKYSRSDYRQQIDVIWKKLRRMAQERNALVITASQAGRAAFHKDAKEENIAEDIRKIAHVSKMIAINKSKADEKIKAVRIEQLAERDGRRNYKQALVLQCLEIGRPYLDSKYVDEVLLEKEDEK